MRMQSLLPLLVFVLSSQMAFAQWNIVQETEKAMSFGVRPGFRIDFTNTDADVVESIWKDYAKKKFGAKLKKNKKTNEWFAEKLNAAVMGSEPFTLYSMIEKAGNNSVVLTVWIDAGSYFLNRRDNASRTSEVSRSLQYFYYDVRRASINAEIKEQEKKLVELEKKQKQMQKDNDNLHKDIENYKAKIKKAEDDIVKNERDQEANVVDQETQRRLIEETRRRLNNVENEQN